MSLYLFVTLSPFVEVILISGGNIGTFEHLRHSKFRFVCLFICFLFENEKNKIK